MNNESADEPAVRAALKDVIPPLREPADRITEIGERVRRSRARRASTLTALTVVAVLAGAGALQVARSSQQNPGPTATNAVDDCQFIDFPRGTWPPRDTPGPIVPEGAIRATLCERPTIHAMPSPPVPPDYSPRVLVKDVGELVKWANTVPVPAEAERLCFAIGYHTDMFFVFSYPDRPPLTVSVNRNCHELVTTEHDRSFPYESALGTFYKLYRAQLSATTQPSTIPTPQCPATHDARVDHIGTSPADGIGRNRGFEDALLPEPLVALAACRYRLNDGTWVLVRQEQRRTELEPVRQAANATNYVRSTPECMWTVKDAMRPTLVDSLWVADTTGAVTEVRVWRQPCAAFHTAGSGLSPGDALLAQLDALLGNAS